MGKSFLLERETVLRGMWGSSLGPTSEFGQIETVLSVELGMLGASWEMFGLFKVVASDVCRS